MLQCLEVKLPRPTTTLEDITSLIFLKHKVKRVDLVIVPGTSHPQLTQTACSLYFQGFANKLIFTGHLNPKINRVESEFSKEIALGLGVPEKDIYCESESTNTKENAVLAKKLIQKNRLRLKKIILVSKPYHARRLYMTFKKIFQKSEIFIHPTEDNYKITSTNWWKDKIKTEKVIEEVGKISEYYLKGDLSLN